MDDVERFFERMEVARIKPSEFSQYSGIGKSSLTLWKNKVRTPRKETLASAEETLDRMIEENKAALEQATRDPHEGESE